MPAIRVENLVKRFGAITALDGLSFEVAEGSVGRAGRTSGSDSHGSLALQIRVLAQHA